MINNPWGTAGLINEWEKYFVAEISDFPQFIWFSQPFVSDAMWYKVKSNILKLGRPRLNYDYRISKLCNFKQAIQFY